MSGFENPNTNNPNYWEQVLVNEGLGSDINDHQVISVGDSTDLDPDAARLRQEMLRTEEAGDDLYRSM